MKKNIALLLASVMLLSATGCATKDEAHTNAVEEYSHSNKSSTAKEKGESSAGSADISTTAAAVSGEEYNVAEGDYITFDDVAFDAAIADSATGGFDEYMEAPEYGDCIEIPFYEEEYIQPSAGLLTGGEWRDNDHWNDWVSLYQTHDDWNDYREVWDIEYTSRHEVIVTANGVPVEGAVVTQDIGAVRTAITDNRGRAYLYFNDSNADQVYEITAEYNGASASVTTPMEGDGSYTIDLGQADMQDVEREKSLDLMLMIDTTGSMTDELMYLQKELEDVIKRVKKDNANLDVRVSVNFYRDEYDDYIIREFDFSDDINSVLTDLAAQDANGGGDYPEAVHTALNSALNAHDWNEDATKLMFFVLDAPPHDDAQIIDEVHKHISDAAAQGIRIIPVASSGIDKSTEYLLRTMAFMTGGTYTFLTDDSGIGGSHIEPTIGDYQVEKLNDMMVRIINDYLTTVTDISISDDSSNVQNSAELSMENLIFSAAKNYPSGADPFAYHFLFTTSDGAIYKAKYDDELQACKHIQTCDDAADELLAQAELVGYIPESDIDRINELIALVDADSDFYDRSIDDNGLAPDVEETVHYTTYCYYNGENGKAAFHIASRGKEQGTSYKTYDENAQAVLDLIWSSDFYQEWAE
ncbi:MAG: VWA domain-containing protein [Ruminococcaceae bacterium]|nr:VWA domain-containing protein [Oscillospiraceae bacterium]